MPAFPKPAPFPVPGPLKGLSDFFFPPDSGIESVAPTPMSAIGETTGRGALRELLNIIKSYKKDPMAELAASVTTHRPPPRVSIKAPEGFTFGGKAVMRPRRATAVREASDAYSASIPSRSGDVRFRSTPEELPNINKLDFAPAVTSLEELGSTVAQPGVVPPKKALVGRGIQNNAPVRTKNFKVNDISPAEIVNIQKLTGSGTNLQQMQGLYPHLSRETLTKVIKMPWKW